MILQFSEDLTAPRLTIQQHIVAEQTRFPGATGEFSFLLSGLTLATKKIQALVRRAGINKVLGEYGNVNVQGESQQILDVYSNEVMIQSLASRKSVGVIASEEETHARVIHNSPDAKYAVIFDPLDGSSNIDVNVSVGTTFSIFRAPEGAASVDANEWVLQKGFEQIGAGYVVYGSSTVMVYTVGNGVHGFTLDPNVGAYVLSHENIRMPNRGKSYSVNEAYFDEFPPHYKNYIRRLRNSEDGNYRSRYIGSMVADFHRTLLRGGVFLYPPTSSYPSGKLRLLYEANPIAMIAEQAGGVALDGQFRILDIEPTEVHQRTPIVVGSQHEMDLFLACAQGAIDCDQNH
jgi:fructose-1,6-bisphosphatase I